MRHPPRSSPFPYTTLFRSPTGRTPTLVDGDFVLWESNAIMQYVASHAPNTLWPDDARARADIVRWQSWQLAHWSGEACQPLDRKSTRLNSSHRCISYAVFC